MVALGLVVAACGDDDAASTGASFYSSELSGSITTPAPKLGEHTRAIASEVFGLSDDQIESAIRSGTLHG